MKKVFFLIISLSTIVLCNTGLSQSPKFRGKWDFSFEYGTGDQNDIIIVKGGQIVNQSNSTTGNIEVMIHASKTPFKGGETSGESVYYEGYNPLPARMYYNDNTLTQELDKYDPECLRYGDYYFMMTLGEIRKGKLKITDYILFGKRSYSPPKSDVSQLRNDNLVDSRDNKTYKTVIIGNKLWMAENLNYRSGGYGVCYDNRPENCQKYGALYNWKDAQKVCPYGWHLPDKSEFENLMTQLKNEGYGLFSSLMSGGHSGFNAVNGGWQAIGGTFGAGGERATFWSSDESGTNSAWVMGTNGSESKVEMVNTAAKVCGFSVRCIRD